MISAHDFKQRWQAGGEDILVPFPATSLEDVRIPENAKAFLIEAGLPADAAPFLSFELPKKGPLPRVPEKLWHLTPDYARFRIIGSNGAGDPICLDEETEGQVIYLNHDNYFERLLINSSVFTLAECLLAFRAFLADTTPLTQERIGLLMGCLRRIDSEPCEPGGFWDRACKALDSTP